MTTASPVKTAPPIQPRPPVAAGSAPAGAPSIDIAKMLKKYAWLLVGAAVLGAVLGTVAYLVLLRVMPIYRPKVFFEVLAPTTDIGTLEGGNTDQDEQERFMATQVAIMKSDSVIQKVVTDPRFLVNGGDLAQKFVEGGTLNAADAHDWLIDNLSSKVVPNTNILELSLGWRSPQDVTNVLGLVRETYLNNVRQSTQGRYLPQRTQLETQIREIAEQIADKQLARETILGSENVDSLDERYAAANQELVGVITSLQELRFSMEALASQLASYEAELNSPAGPTYSPELIQAVEAEPLMQTMLSRISETKSSIATLKLLGFGPEHRDVIRAEMSLEAQEARFADERNRLLSKRFNALVSGYRNTLATMQSQQTQLTQKNDELVTRLIELTQTFVKVDDLKYEIDRAIETQANLEDSLNSMRSIGALQSSTRILVAQQERRPDKPVFPNVFIMIPAGVVLLTGLTSGVVFLREIFDQRVKGPSDVTMIPRTRLLGIIPDADEDSAIAAEDAASAFRKAPQGAVAEGYRQIRSPLLKRLDLAGHKTVMVMSGMPGSGASSTTSNLAEACASAERRVLVIDANFRRPEQHRIFGLSDAPGLADVLAGDSTLESAAQSTHTAGLDLLSAGAAKSRVVERLSTAAFSELLAAAAAEYDLVLVDVPPAIVAGDGVSVANRCDASILVARAYAEKRGLVSRVRNELSETRAEFIGVIVNGVRSSAGGYLKGNIRASQDYLKQSA